jgi:hypothetical protein
MQLGSPLMLKNATAISVLFMNRVLIAITAMELISEASAYRFSAMRAEKLLNTWERWFKLKRELGGASASLGNRTGELLKWQSDKKGQIQS